MSRDAKVVILFVGGPKHGESGNVKGTGTDVLENTSDGANKHRYEEKQLICGRWVMEHKGVIESVNSMSVFEPSQLRDKK